MTSGFDYHLVLSTNVVIPDVFVLICEFCLYTIHEISANLVFVVVAIIYNSFL